MARSNKVAHVVLDARDAEASLRFYAGAVEMEIVAPLSLVETAVR